MSGSLFTRKIGFYSVCLAILLAAIGAVLFGGFKSQAQPSKAIGEKHQDISKLFITVDEKELTHIQTLARQNSFALNPDIIEKHGDLLIAAAENHQLLELTGQMHEEFQKCGGFIAHKSLEEARRSVEETSFAAVNQPVAEYTINNQPLVNSLLAEAQETQIRETITRLSTEFPNRRYNTQSGLNSANWIKNKWTELAAGRADITVEFFNHPTFSPQPSVIMTVQGTTFPNEVVVIGGHQDSINGAGATVDAPGADDDASGIASITEAIRVMTAKNFRPQRTVKFMAYAAEEVGLRGSNEIAADFQARGVNVIGVLQLDMTNYSAPGAPAEIAVMSDATTNASQNQFLKDLIATYQPTVTVTESSCGYGCSDHVSWTNKGYAASFPFEAPFRTHSNPYIHTTGDTIAQSGGNANHALKFTKLAVSYLVELAKGPVSVSGKIVYGTTPENEPQKTVPGALVTAENGATPATTDFAGAFLFQNLTPGGDFTVRAAKTGDENGVSPLDATLVLRYVAFSGQGVVLTPNQLSAADATGSGGVTALDATVILRYAAAGTRSAETGNVGNWKLSPDARNYSSLFNSVSNQNFTAVLIGDVNGSWTPPN